MVFCLVVGVAIWYMLRRCVIGRWRDIIRFAWVPLLVSFPVQAQDGQEQFEISITQYKYNAANDTYSGNSVGGNNPFFFWTGPSSDFRDYYIYIPIVNGRGGFWAMTDIDNTISGWPNDTPYQQTSFTFTKANDDWWSISFTGAFEYSGYVSGQGSYVFTAMDPQSPPATFGADYVFLIDVNGTYQEGSGGSGSDDPAEGFQADAEPERLREFDFAEGGIQSVDGGQEVGDEGDFTADAGSLFSNQRIDSASASNSLPIDVPDLNHNDDLAGSIDFIMTSFLSDAWSSPEPDSTHEKFLQLFGFSSWLQLIQEFESSAELARDVYFEPLHRIVRTITTVILSWFAFAFILSCYNGAMEMEFFNLIAETSKEVKSELTM